jgi:hypothetical protein
MNFYMNKYLCNCDTVTLCDTALCYMRQEAAQEVERIAQEVTAESIKAKKAECYRVTMEKLGKLPPCPKLCRGGECSGIPCEEEEPSFPYSHIDNMVVCHDKSHMSMATRDGCYLFHLWPARKRSTKPPAPAKNSGGGTSGTRHVPPSNRSNQRKTGKPQNANSTGNGTQRQQQERLDHKRAIEKLNLELEVAKTNAANVSYASIVKGMPRTTTSETATASAAALAAASASATLYERP